MVMRRRSSGTLGRGKAKITIEVRRYDGVLERLTFHRVHLADPEDSTMEMFSEDVPGLGLNSIFDPDAPRILHLELQGKLFEVEDRPTGELYYYEKVQDGE